MKEKVIENWLTKASERTFQHPFCFLLMQKGHRVIHSTRHCAMELGKDIISITSDKTPHVFQLKSDDISLSKWREINSQIMDLCYTRVVHPSLKTAKLQQPWLVTNGVIEEEVARAIADLNTTLTQRKLLPLKTITKFELLDDFSKLENNLWPYGLTDLNAFLEIYLEDGKGIFPKEKFSRLLERVMPFQKASKKKPSKNECQKAISSASVLTATVLANFSNNQNFSAEIEAWVIFSAYSMALANKWQYKTLFRFEVDIALDFIHNSLEDLVKELQAREVYVEGNAIFDNPFHPYRMTHLLAYTGIYGLWQRLNEEEENEIDDFCRQFALDNKEGFSLWGEAAIPQILAHFWFLTKVDATWSSDMILKNLIYSVCHLKNPNNQSILPNPYYSELDLLPHVIDQQLTNIIKNHGYKLNTEPLAYSFKGHSHVLEGLMYMFVKLNWKQSMKLLWPLITQISFARFEFKEPWHFFHWNNEKGKNITIMPKHTKSWKELNEDAERSAEGKNIPPQIQEYPILLLLFLCVCPHRLSPDNLNWLDVQISKI